MRASERPRVLLVAYGSLLDPRGGNPSRSRATAESLADLGMAPAVISTEEPGIAGGVVPASELPSWLRELHILHDRTRHGFSLELTRTIAGVARRSDAVIVSDATFWPALAMARTGLPIIWDSNECQTLHYRRLPFNPRDAVFGAGWRVLEGWAARTCRVCIAIGEREAEWWTQLYPRLDGKVAVVDHRAHVRTPHGTGPTANWESGTGAGRMPPRAVLDALCGRPVRGTVLLFIGTLVAKHNAAAARWLLDVLAPQLPADTHLVLCGPGTELLVAPPAAASVHLLGGVEDIDSVIASADWCLAPLRSGAGVKTKVLHYLEHAKPVIGTPLAFEGVDAAPGLHAVSLDEMPRAVLKHLAHAEDDASADNRRKQQLEWIDCRCGRLHVTKQWENALQWLHTT